MYSFARRLAGAYEDADFCVERNISAAALLLQICIDEQRHTAAMYDYAGLIFNEIAAADVSHNVPTFKPFDPFNPLLPPKLALALNLCQASAIEGANLKAMVDVARILSHGNVDETSFDISAAVRWYEMYLERCDDLEAGSELADILSSRAPYVRTDLPHAICLYERRLQNGHVLSEARFFVIKLAELLIMNIHGVQKDVPRAVRLCELFAHLCSASGIEKLRELANKVARGTTIISKDVPLAINLFEICIDPNLPYPPDAEAVACLVEILLTEDMRTMDHVNRALQLCDKFLGSAHCGLVLGCRLVNIARQLSYGPPLIVKGIPLSIRLLKMCMASSRHTCATFALIELLIEGIPGFERDTAYALEICTDAIEKMSENYLIERLVPLCGEIFDDPFNRGKNALFASEVLTLCVSLTYDMDAAILLTQVLGTGAPGVERNEERALQMCREVIRKVCAKKFVSRIVKLASLVFGGTARLLKDAKFAMRLLELCIEITGDSNATILLIEMLIYGGPGFNKNQRRALQLCKNHMETKTYEDRFIHRLVILVQKISFGASNIPEGAPLALRLLEICLAKCTSVKVSLALIELLVSGVLGVGRNTRRAIQVFERVLEAKPDFDDISMVANEIVRGSSRIMRDAPLGVYLLEMCIKEGSDPAAKLALADILITSAPGIERDTSRAAQLCMEYIKESGSNTGVGRLARKLAWSECGNVRDMQLALNLCEKCENADSGNDGILVLVEILLSGAAGSERNIPRAIRLCRTYLMESDGTDGVGDVKDIANKVARGSGVVRDTSLAIRLYELCIERQNEKGCFSPSNGLMPLVKMLTAGSCGVERDVRLALQLCEKYTKTWQWCEVVKLAEDFTFGANDVVQDVPIAMKIWDVCIRCAKNPDYKIHLAEILLIDGTGIEQDIGRALELCEQFLIECTMTKTPITEVLELARRVWGMRSVITEGALIAKSICEMCIKFYYDENAMVLLAEMFACGSDGIERNVESVVQLCEQHLVECSNCRGVENVAEKIAKGLAGIAADLPLAVRLYDMCVKRGSSRAMFYLSGLLKRGCEGVEVDEERSLALYKRAMEGGFDGEWVNEGG